MSIDFDALTSKLEHTTATGYDVATQTIAVWEWADGIGETNGGIFQAPEGGSIRSPGLIHDGAVNVLQFYYAWSGTDGQWTFPATDGQWNAVAVSYDAGATTNDPVARVNFAPVTVTETVTPTGASRTSPATGYCIGNVTAQTRTWDGALQHLQFFNVILTAAEMDAALRVPGSIRRGLVSWWPMWHAGYTVDLANTGFQPTATGLTTRDGAPGSMPWGLKRQGWRGAFTAAAPAGDALGALALNLGWGGMLATGTIRTA